MSTAKQILTRLINDLSESETFEVIDYIRYLKTGKEKVAAGDLQEAGKSSLKFWNNDIDDEIWNNA